MIVRSFPDLWTVSPDQRWQTAGSYLHSISLFSGHLSGIVRSRSHVGGSNSSDWLQTSVGIAQLISPSFCFLDIWVHMFASLDCESRQAMTNSWLISPSVCFLDIWVWSFTATKKKSYIVPIVFLILRAYRKDMRCIYERIWEQVPIQFLIETL